MSSVQSTEKKVLDVKELGEVWKEFEVLAKALTANPGEPFYMSLNDFKSNALHWARKFRRATFDELYEGMITCRCSASTNVHILLLVTANLSKILSCLEYSNC